jgi:hypothetical protein
MTTKTRPLLLLIMLWPFAGAAILNSLVPEPPATEVHISTGDAVKIAQLIARDEGYDLDGDIRDPATGQKVIYWFDSLDGLLVGYTSLGFFINSHIRSGISISNSTGQTLDATTCQVFDYPDLRPFQEQITHLSGVKKKSLEQLAEEVGCESLTVESVPNPATL